MINLSQVKERLRYALNIFLVLISMFMGSIFCPFAVAKPESNAQLIGVKHRPLTKADLLIASYRIEVEIAKTLKQRAEGLMFRHTLGQHQGMLFVFPSSMKYCMWMRNTFIPISVAFLDESGHILNIEDMEPKTETAHCAKKSARYVLEMNKGWFDQQGIAVGTQVKGIP